MSRHPTIRPEAAREPAVTAPDAVECGDPSCRAWHPSPPTLSELAGVEVQTALPRDLEPDDLAEPSAPARGVAYWFGLGCWMGALLILLWALATFLIALAHRVAP